MAKVKLILQPVFLLLLIFSLFSIFPSPANADELKWSRVNTPSSGQSGKWVLADGSDIRSLTQASDGTLYCYANPTATTYRLFKSTDGGYSWLYTGRVEDVIVDIAIVPGKPNSVYYATTSKIFRSTDAGNNFNLIGRNPGGAGAGNVEITSIDVAVSEGSEFVVVGTRDSDPAQFGGVYTLEESQLFDSKDTGIGSYDVYCVAFSPNFASERQITAIATDETDTVISAKTYTAGWGLYVGDARLPGLTPVTAAIAFPADYNSNPSQGKYTQFIALNVGGNRGDVYSLKGRPAPVSSRVTDLNAGLSDGFSNLDISGLVVNGNADKAILLAGTASTARTYFSSDAGLTWSSSNKPPTGTTVTGVLLAPDFLTSGLAYTATSGAESAFSISRDKGYTWVQTGLIDTTITNIRDLAVSANYQQDSTLFLVTSGVQYSLWSSYNGGIRWERLFSSALPQVDRINLVSLSPQFNQNKTIFLSGMSQGAPVFWISRDGGQNFLRTPFFRSQNWCACQY